MQKLEKKNLVFPSVFPTERISKKRNGEIGNMEHLESTIQDSFN